jgi:hypothetical protein
MRGSKPAGGSAHETRQGGSSSHRRHPTGRHRPRPSLTPGIGLIARYSQESVSLQVSPCVLAPALCVEMFYCLYLTYIKGFTADLPSSVIKPWARQHGAGSNPNGAGLAHGGDWRLGRGRAPRAAHPPGAQPAARLFQDCDAQVMLGARARSGVGTRLRGAELTRAPRGLRWVRTGYAYQPPALGTYRTRRAACPHGPAHCTYWVRVPASAVPYAPRTVAPQARSSRTCRPSCTRMACDGGSPPRAARPRPRAPCPARSTDRGVRCCSPYL